MIKIFIRFTLLLAVLTIFLTTCCSAAAAATSAKQQKAKPKKTVWKCDAKDEAEIDEMAAKMITLGREDMKLPLKTAEIKPFCKRELRMLSRGETYKDQCMKGQQKQVFAVAIYTLKQFISQLCKRPKSRKTQELLKAVPCINSGAKEYNQCNIQYIDILESVRDWKGNFKGQIAHVCCGYYQMFTCVREAGARVPACTRQTIEMLLDLVRMNADNVVSMLCGEYSADTDRCDKVRLLAGRGGNSTNRSRSQSFVKPLITILANDDS